VFKKTLLKEMVVFLTLKMLPVALALIKPKKCHLLAPFVKNHLFYMGNRQALNQIKLNLNSNQFDLG